MPYTTFGESQPAVAINPALLSTVDSFHFDTDQYIEGLQLAGLPDPAIETLQVEFAKASKMMPATQKYEEAEHRLQITLRPDLPSMDMGARWHPSDYPNEATMHANYLLARSGKLMADLILKQPDAVWRNRHGHQNGFARSAATASALFLGSAAGAYVSEGIGESVVTASIIGGSIAAAGLGSAFMARDLMPARRRDANRRREHDNVLNFRADKFADSRQAVDIFKNVVSIRFVH